MKDFFDLSKAGRQGLVFAFLLIDILLLIGKSSGFFDREEPRVYNYQEYKGEFEDFLGRTKENLKSVMPPTRLYTRPQPVLTVFDPNTADSVAFLRMGLPAWMAGNIMKYRAKGGRFRKAEDFRKIYGLKEDQYQALKPYITIGEEAIQTPPMPVEGAKVEIPKTFKYQAGTVIDLNDADTTELKKIPGIGTSTALKIVNYRNKLGGFYAVNQLEDINLTRFGDWFTVDNPQINKINLNRAGLEKLRAHPYINFYQAKAIVEFRKKRGSLTGLKQLQLLEEFTEEDLERMKHYVFF